MLDSKSAFGVVSLAITNVDFQPACTYAWKFLQESIWQQRLTFYCKQVVVNALNLRAVKFNSSEFEGKLYTLIVFNWNLLNPNS